MQTVLYDCSLQHMAGASLTEEKQRWVVNETFVQGDSADVPEGVSLGEIVCWELKEELKDNQRVCDF